MSATESLHDLFDGLTVRFWTCPNGHSAEGPPGVVTVDWDKQGVAHCTTDGCPHTSANSLAVDDTGREAMIAFVEARIAAADDARENSVYYSMRHPDTGEKMLMFDEADLPEIKNSRWWLASVADSAAKRLVVEDYREAAAYCDSDWARGRRHAALLAVARVAAMYATHPDYRQEWLP